MSFPEKLWFADLYSKEVVEVTADCHYRFPDETRYKDKNGEYMMTLPHHSRDAFSASFYSENKHEVDLWFAGVTALREHVVALLSRSYEED